jgi:tRNA pseudouridine32 synthase / 23S rRNA pseudouridine746 synthase
MTTTVAGVPVLHLDARIIALDKPSGLLSVPGRLPENKDSLALRVQAAFPGALTVHRLDGDTSGVIVMALDAEAHRALSLQFQERQVEKSYQALAWGQPDTDEGEINLPLMVDWPNRPRSKVDPAGKPSRTHWRVQERLADRCRLMLTPLTGRSHQLRIHLAEIGHPILGDPFYATPAARALAPRLLLHAERLVICHPDGDRVLDLIAPCPF